MTLNKETSKEGFESKLPFSVLFNLETLILTCILVFES